MDTLSSKDFYNLLIYYVIWDNNLWLDNTVVYFFFFSFCVWIILYNLFVFEFWWLCSVQDFVSSVPYHGVFGILIPLLVTILQVHVQGTTHSLFQTHSLNMWISLVATVVYYFACAADMKDKLLHWHATDNSQFFNGIASISGSLSTVGFVSVLLSRLGGCIIFLVWGLVSIVLVMCKNAETIKGGVVWLYQKMRGVEKQRLPRLSV